jgi:hypothetical protein
MTGSTPVPATSHTRATTSSTDHDRPLPALNASPAAAPASMPSAMAR